MKIVTTNVVVRIELGQPLDLDALYEIWDDGLYEPDKLPGIIYKKEKMAFIIFDDGHILATGFKSEQEAHDKCKDFGNMILKMVE